MRLAPLLLVASIAASAHAAGVRTVTLSVRNMTCPVCPITVKAALKQVPGVLVAKVDLESKTAIVEFDPDKTTVGALTQATKNAGYPSTVRR